MTEAQKLALRWGRHAAEVVSIVIGILLALAADAGRQYLADRASEREILAELRIEFAADVAELNSDQDSRRQKLASIDLLRGLRTGALETPASEALAAALVQVLDYRYYTGSHPTLDDLVATGRLDLIRSAELRHALMVFGQQRSRIAVVEQRERDFVADQFEPYVAARLDLDALASGSPEAMAVALEDLPVVLADRTFGSLLYVDRERTGSSLRFGQLLRTAVDTVLQALGDES